MEPRITPERFNQLALQLVASGLCATRKDLEKLVCSTFSGLREQHRNLQAFAEWPRMISAAIGMLLSGTLVIQSSSGRLAATPVGKAIAYSGLQPESGLFLLKYATGKAERLVSYLPAAERAGDIERLTFVMLSACLSCPEFRPGEETNPTRVLPYPLDKDVLFDADIYKADLSEPIWQADLMPINGTKLACDWILGAQLRNLESSLPQLSAGVLRDMFRNLAWTLQGFAAVIWAASDVRVPTACRLEALRDRDDTARMLSRLPRFIRRLSLRVSEGLPDDVLWMLSIRLQSSTFRLTRGEILSLRSSGYNSPQKAMLGSGEADAVRLTAFAKAKPAPVAKANWFRDACREWKAEQRKRASEWQTRRARRCPRGDLVSRFYEAKGTMFERNFEEVLAYLKINFERLDDKSKTGAPDYLSAAI